ncbi:hypothetical protein ABZW30_18830 [Kitasatospora sp. NPDC004669]|uniref:hypothetical protein n=1 Tax=Kitasatospora sp. NPDC004669 TaxID=3154555 RepID=UPI0033AA0993
MAAVAFVLLMKFLYGVGRNTIGVNANRRLLATDPTTPGGRANTTTSGFQLPVFGESSALLALDVDLPPGEPAATEEPASAQPATAQWDTGEPNVMLVAGRQQYLAEQAALQQQQYQATPRTPATFWGPRQSRPRSTPDSSRRTPSHTHPRPSPASPGPRIRPASRRSTRPPLLRDRQAPPRIRIDALSIVSVPPPPSTSDDKRINVCPEH